MTDTIKNLFNSSSNKHMYALCTYFLCWNFNTFLKLLVNLKNPMSLNQLGLKMDNHLKDVGIMYLNSLKVFIKEIKKIFIFKKTFWFTITIFIFKGLWSTRDIEVKGNRQTYVRTTIRELVIYVIFLAVLFFSKYGINFLKLQE